MRPINRLQLFRSLLPSWKFFDDVESFYALGVRTRTANGAFGEWAFAGRQTRIYPSAIFYNPGDHFRHAENSLVENFAHDLFEISNRQTATFQTDGAHKLTSYQLVKLLAQERALKTEPRPSHFQFALILKSFEDERRAGQEAFVSPEYGCPNG